MIAIVRREMNAAEAIELMMPAIQPAELWIESGRGQRYGTELLRIKDRPERDFVFGPTHEEVITDTVRRDVKSYRQLPFNLYQIQTKFRDEIRPRFGLMRGREFIMKDAYSFGADAASLDESYEAMRKAYCRIFEACGLDYTMVEADSGAIGRQTGLARAPMAFSAAAHGRESDVALRAPAPLPRLRAANVERAESRRVEAAGEAHPQQDMQEIATPGKRTIEEVSRFLKISPKRLVKTLIYETEKGLVVALVRGDREVNEVKLANHFDVQHLTLAGREEKVRAATGAPAPASRDRWGSRTPRWWVTSGSVRWSTSRPAPIRRMPTWSTSTGGGTSTSPTGPTCCWSRGGIPARAATAPSSSRAASRGRAHLQAGHQVFGGDGLRTYTDEAGADKPMIMGCYGVGIGRTVAAAIEQNHDKDGHRLAASPRPPSRRC